MAGNATSRVSMRRQTAWKFDAAILVGIRSAPPAQPAPAGGNAGVRIDYAVWLGRKPSRAETVHLSRNLTSLEARGLVVRLPFRRAALTTAGAVLARELDPLGTMEIGEIEGAP